MLQSLTFSSMFNLFSCGTVFGVFEWKECTLIWIKEVNDFQSSHNDFTFVQKSFFIFIFICLDVRVIIITLLWNWRKPDWKGWFSWLLHWDSFFLMKVALNCFCVEASWLPISLSSRLCMVSLLWSLHFCTISSIVIQL